AHGVGYRFNAEGASTDGVTPLPWPFLLAALSIGADALSTLVRAKVLGLLAWGGSAFFLGRAVTRVEAHDGVRVMALVVLGLCLPVAAHSVSGMETGVVLALATGAAVGERAWLAALLAGLAAAFRPELAPWALALGVGRSLALGEGRKAVLRAAAVALGPPLLVAVARLVVFGRAAPLAVLAKPADLSQGGAYAAVGMLVTLTPLLVVSPALLRAGGRPRALAVAAFVHALAVVAAGGDWMPYARLLAPIAPGLLLAFVESSPRVPRWSLGSRWAASMALGVYLVAKAAPAGRHVMDDRRALVVAAAPMLASYKHVAAVDVGWVSAATEADVVDLAGLTDLSVAVLPGSHTSKRVDPSMLFDRKVDAILFYVERPVPEGTWRNVLYPHSIDTRLARSDLFAEHYAPVGFLPLGSDGRGYVLLAARP
ncbi:MAG TPA: hypothetical protein VF316_01420, partial [Polyangiaceae bacterium]